MKFTLRGSKANRCLQAQFTTRLFAQRNWNSNCCVCMFWQLTVVIRSHLVLFKFFCNCFCATNKEFSMTSEGIWHFKPYAISKAYLLTAYGLRTIKHFFTDSLIFLIKWVFHIGLWYHKQETMLSIVFSLKACNITSIVMQNTPCIF